jgi:hypothetical protein
MGLLLIRERPSGRTTLNKKAKRSALEHQKWIREQVAKVPKHGKVTIDRTPAPLAKRGSAPLSNAVGNGFSKSVDDYKWKKDRQETAATVKAIEQKKKRLVPLYSKGPVQYVTNETDKTTLGRKV